MGIRETAAFAATLGKRSGLGPQATAAPRTWPCAGFVHTSTLHYTYFTLHILSIHTQGMASIHRSSQYGCNEEPRRHIHPQLSTTCLTRFPGIPWYGHPAPSLACVPKAKATADVKPGWGYFVTYVQEAPRDQRRCLGQGLRGGGPGTPPFWRTREELCTVRNSALTEFGNSSERLGTDRDLTSGIMASLVVDVELEKANGTKVAGASLKDCPLVAYYYSAHWWVSSVWPRPSRICCGLQERFGVS